ncbi:MAG: PspC domain-containing protein [Caldilineaceae bacterium]|nr:PspC domain-containing protein [Caldilineaceae bacterium]
MSEERSPEMKSDFTTEAVSVVNVEATPSGVKSPGAEDLQGNARSAAASAEPPTESRGGMLYRHPTHRLIGGVCGGIGEYTRLDPSLVRVLWVVLTVGSAGAGFLAYLALWLLLPVGTAHSGMQSPATLELNERNVWRAGMGLVGLGLLWLLANVGILPWLWVAFWRTVGLLFWPGLLIGAGLLLLNNQQNLRSRFATSRERMRSRFSDGSGKVKESVRVDRESVKSGLHKAKRAIPFKRSRTDRIFYGVCGAIGQAINLDPNLVRLIWVAFSIGSVGMGVLVYILAGLLLPEEEPAAQVAAFGQEPKDVQIIDGTIG